MNGGVKHFYLKEMNILITGANGFIGRNLIAELLISSDYKIIGVNRTTSLFKGNKYLHIKSDITKKNWLKKIQTNIDVIIHLAQSRNYKLFPKEALNIFQTNVLATNYLLDWGRKNKISKFIFASSGNVYKQSNSMLKEDDKCEPASYYGATKLCSELLIKQYKQYYDIKILRLFGVYGKDQRNMLIPNIMNSIKEEQEIKLAKGDGLFITPLFIEDCVSMLKLLIANKKDEHTIYNISGSEIISLKQIVNIISKRVMKEPIIKITSSNPTYFIGSNKLFINEFNFRKKLTSFIKGVKSLC